MELLLILLGIVVVYCLFMLVRNSVVYNIRSELLNNDYSSYKLLPSYDSMMYQWTMWTTKSYLNLYVVEKEAND